MWLPLLVTTAAMLLQSAAFAQTKPERQSKAVKPTKATSPTATRSDQKPPVTERIRQPEDKLFKGMKIASSAPFAADAR